MVSIMYTDMERGGKTGLKRGISPTTDGGRVGRYLINTPTIHFDSWKAHLPY